MSSLPILVAILFMVVLVVMSVWPPRSIGLPPANAEPPAVDDKGRHLDEPAASTGEQPAGSGGRAGAVIGFVIGFAGARIVTGGAGLEHGAPGIGVYILYQQFVAPTFWGLMAAVIGFGVGDIVPHSGLLQWFQHESSELRARGMSRRQKAVLWIGIAIAFAMLLYPPWSLAGFGVIYAPLFTRWAAPVRISGVLLIQCLVVALATIGTIIVLGNRE